MCPTQNETTWGDFSDKAIHTEVHRSHPSLVDFGSTVAYVRDNIGQISTDAVYNVQYMVDESKLSFWDWMNPFTRDTSRYFELRNVEEDNHVASVRFSPNIRGSILLHFQNAQRSIISIKPRNYKLTFRGYALHASNWNHIMVLNDEPHQVVFLFGLKNIKRTYDANEERYKTRTRYNLLYDPDVLSKTEAYCLVLCLQIEISENAY